MTQAISRSDCPMGEWLTTIKYCIPKFLLKPNQNRVFLTKPATKYNNNNNNN